MFSKTEDFPLVFYLDFVLLPRGNCVNLETSLGSYKPNLNMGHVFKVNLAAVSLPRTELRRICFVIGEITSEPL